MDLRSDQGRPFTAPQFYLAGSEKAVAGVPDGQIVDAHYDVPARGCGLQPRADVPRMPAGHGEGVDLADGLDHIQRALRTQVQL